MEDFKLDNPVWYALGESHKEHCIDYGDSRFYRMPYANFGAISENIIHDRSLLIHLDIEPSVYMVGQLPPNESGKWQVVKAAHCAQMVCHEVIRTQPLGLDIIALDESHKAPLYDLINLVQPGYYFPETQSLGQYYGIVINNQLVAAAGERVRLDNSTEVSGVVTHPDYLKRGFASALVEHATQAILAQEKLPFLHVLATNEIAISVYHKLGYILRREMVWSKIELT